MFRAFWALRLDGSLTVLGEIMVLALRFYGFLPIGTGAELDDDIRAGDGAAQLFDRRLKHVAHVDRCTDLGGNVADGAFLRGALLGLVVQAGTVEGAAQF